VTCLYYYEANLSMHAIATIGTLISLSFSRPFSINNISGATLTSAASAKISAYRNSSFRKPPYPACHRQHERFLPFSGSSGRRRKKQSYTFAFKIQGRKSDHRFHRRSSLQGWPAVGKQTYSFLSPRNWSKACVRPPQAACGAEEDLWNICLPANCDVMWWPCFSSNAI